MNEPLLRTFAILVEMNESIDVCVWSKQQHLYHCVVRKYTFYTEVFLLPSSSYTIVDLYTTDRRSMCSIIEQHNE
jgi:hypothetical protein